MEKVTRLLVVDGSELLAWMVARVAPSGVEVSRAASMSQAEKIFANSPPDAAIFNLHPWHSVWKSLIERCTSKEPPIPFLCTAAMRDDEASEGDLPCAPGDFISLDMTPGELARAVGFLLKEARRCDPDRGDDGHAGGADPPSCRT